MPDYGLPRPTLQQVALEAGVSPKTVSRVINGEKWVSPATAERVLEAAAALGFRRNAAARDLQIGRPSSLVGLVIADVSNSFYASIARGCERVLRARGLQLLTVSTDEDPATERFLVGQLVERRVAGLLVATSDGSGAIFEREIQLGTPVVFVDRRPSELISDAVVLDNEGGTERAIQHLLDRGHTKIGFIGDLQRLPTAHERWRAFQRVMQQTGVPKWDRWMAFDAHDEHAAAAATAKFLSDNDPPTAVFAANNRLTMGTLREIRRRGSDTALVGFDDFDAADLLGISVVSYDSEQLGTLAAQLLLERLSSTTRGPAQVATIATDLLVRASS